MPALADPELRAKESRRRRELRWKWDAAKHIRTMRIRGLPLLLTYRNGTPHWRLGDVHIETGAAELIIRNRNIVGVGDALFAGTRSQTYRYAENSNNGGPNNGR